MERTFSYTTSDGHKVVYTISRRDNFVANQFGADTKEGIEAAKREVWQALAAYRATQC